MQRYFESRLIKLISPITSEIFTLELAGEENELREWIATICNVNAGAIKGIRDSFGNYYTISSAIKNPQLTTDYSTFYFVILGGQNQQQNTNKYNIYHKGIDTHPSQHYLGSVVNGISQDMLPISMNMSGMNSIVKMNQISQGHHNNNFQLSALPEGHSVHALPQGYSNFLTNDAREMNSNDIYVQIIHKLKESQFIDSTGVWKLKELLAEENEELVTLFKIYLKHGLDIKILAEQIVPMVTIYQVPGAIDKKTEDISIEKNKNELFNIDTIKDEFENEKDFRLIKQLIFYDNEQVSKVWSTYDADHDLRKLIDSFHLILHKYREPVSAFNNTISETKSRKGTMKKNTNTNSSESNQYNNNTTNINNSKYGNNNEINNTIKATPKNDKHDKKNEERILVDNIKDKLLSILQSNNIRFDIISLFNYDMKQEDPKTKLKLFFDSFKIPKDSNFKITPKVMQFIEAHYLKKMTLTLFSSLDENEFRFYDKLIENKNEALLKEYDKLLQSMNMDSFKKNVTSFVKGKIEELHNTGNDSYSDSGSSKEDNSSQLEEEEEEEEEVEDEDEEVEESYDNESENVSDDEDEKVANRNDYVLGKGKESKENANKVMNYNYNQNKGKWNKNGVKNTKANVSNVTPAEDSDNKGSIDEEDEEEDEEEETNSARKKQYISESKMKPISSESPGKDSSILDSKMNEFIKLINALSFSEWYKSEICNLLKNKDEEMWKLYERFKKSKPSLTKNALVAVINRKGVGKNRKSNPKNEVAKGDNVNAVSKENSTENAETLKYCTKGNNSNSIQKQQISEKPLLFKNKIKKLIANNSIPRNSYGLLVKKFNEMTNTICSFWEIYLSTKDEDDFLESLQFFIAKFENEIQADPMSPSSSSNENGGTKMSNGNKKPVSINNLKKDLWSSEDNKDQNKNNNTKKLFDYRKPGNTIKKADSRSDEKDVSVEDDKDESLKKLEKIMRIAKYTEKEKEMIIVEYNKKNEMLMSILELYNQEDEDDEEDTIDSLKAFLNKIKSMSENKESYLGFQRRDV